MLPTKERRDRIAFWLAKAKARYPGIELWCVVQMGNHLHLCLRDRESNLSAFMRDFLGHCAKSLNRLDHVRGTVFERRYTAIPIVDVDAAVRRVAYAVCNPVDAGLVRSYRDWTGLCIWYGTHNKETLTYFHEGKYKRALKEAERTGQRVRREDFEETAALDLDPIDGVNRSLVADAIDARETELQKKHKRFMGLRKILAQSPFDRPRMPKRSAMPLCLFTCREAKRAFARGWFRFLEEYNVASEAFRAGDLDVSFPMFSFRPMTPATE